QAPASSGTGYCRGQFIVEEPARSLDLRSGSYCAENQLRPALEDGRSRDASSLSGSRARVPHAATQWELLSFIRIRWGPSRLSTGGGGGWRRSRLFWPPRRLPQPARRWVRRPVKAEMESVTAKVTPVTAASNVVPGASLPGTAVPATLGCGLPWGGVNGGRATERWCGLPVVNIAALGLDELDAALRGLASAQALIGKPRITFSDGPCWRRFDQS